MGSDSVFDQLLDRGEDLYESGKKLAGDAVAIGTRAVGGLLDHVGLDPWGSLLERLGEAAADRLGATPDEKQLGESENPRDLVHGDPGALRGAGQRVSSLAAHFEKGGEGLRGISAGEFEGESADVTI